MIVNRGDKVKYVGDFEGQIKTGTILTIQDIEISFGTRSKEWITTIRTVEKDVNGEDIILFLTCLVPAT